MGYEDKMVPNYFKNYTNILSINKIQKSFFGMEIGCLLVYYFMLNGIKTAIELDFKIE